MPQVEGYAREGKIRPKFVQASVKADRCWTPPNEEFYNLVLQYYGQNPDNSIIVHEQGGATGSDLEAWGGGK